MTDIAEISPEEFSRPERGELALPPGWTLKDAGRCTAPAGRVNGDRRSQYAQGVYDQGWVGLAGTYGVLTRAKELPRCHPLHYLQMACESWAMCDPGTTYCLKYIGPSTVDYTCYPPSSCSTVSCGCAMKSNGVNVACNCSSAGNAVTDVCSVF